MKANKILALLLSFVVLLGVLPFGALADSIENVATDFSTNLLGSGQCGEAVYWTLDTDGVLTLEGIGGTYNWSSNNQPWYEQRLFVKRVVVKDGVTKIGQYAFYGHTNLYAFELADSVHTIGYSAFANCDALTEVVIPDTVTTLGSYAFSSCDNLESVVIGEGITQLPSSIFENCAKLKSISIPQTLRTIESAAFYGCTALTDVYCRFTEPYWNSLVVSTHYDYNKHFLAATRHFETPDEAEVAYSGQCGDNVYWTLDTDGVLTLEGTGGTYNWNSNNQPWYTYRYSVKKIVVKEGVTKIGNDAFYGHTNLYAFELADSVHTIGSYAFYNCDSLNELMIPDTVTTLGSYAFSSCDNLESVVIGEGITQLPSSIFENCAKLKSISIPQTLRTIESAAFHGCTALTDVYCRFTESYWNSLVVSTHYDYNKHFLAATRHFETPDEAEIAYSGQCGDNVYWTLDTDGVLTLEGTGGTYNWNSNNQPWYTYRYSVKKIVVKEGVTKIGNDAFYGHTNLYAFELADSVHTIGSYAFYNCDSLTELMIPDTLTTLGSYAFSSCDNLESVVIGEGITQLPSGIFENCAKLKSISIPQTLRTIESAAFYGCTALTDVYCRFTEPYWNSLVDGTHYRYNQYFLDATRHFETVEPAEVVYSGQCGDAVYWTLDTDGVLRLTGHGSLYSTSSYPWFDYRLAVTEIIVDEAIGKITGSCISDCKNATSITMSEGAPVTGTCGNDVNYTFELNRDYWNDVYHSGTLTIYGNGAMFDYNSNAVPWKSYAISKIVINDGVTRIGSYAFSNCPNLTEIVMADSVKEIGSYAFNNCDALVDVIIPDGVETVEREAFHDCSALTTVVFGDSVTSIGYEAFYSCQKLTEITLPFSLQSIDSYAFGYCSALTTVNYLYTEAWWKEVAGNDGLGNATINYLTIEPAEIVFSGTCGEATTWTIDSNGVLTVDGIGRMYDYSSNNTPWNNYKLAITKVVINDGVTRIGSYAFSNCPNLTEIVMADSVKTIGQYAFNNCDALVDVIIPDGVETVEREAFYDCSALTTVVFGDSVTSIGYEAFYSCQKLTEITLPFALQSIDSYAFGYCSALTTVNYLYTEAWWKEVAGNDGLGNATINYLTIEPAEIVFSGTCGEATTWTIDSNGVLTVDGIGRMHDYNSYTATPWANYRLAVTKVVINDGVTRIGSYAFSNCPNLTEIVMADSVKEIGSYAFNNCDALVDVIIPDGVETVEREAFHDCSALTTVVFGDSVTSIGYEAFYSCQKLTEITLPFALQSIDSYAFGYCSALTTVNYLYTEAWWKEVAGNDGLGNATINYLTIEPAEIVFSGTCGEATTWTIDSDGVLTVDGIGRMHDYSSNNTPWNNYKLAITKVVINDGVTRIGSYAFSNCPNLTEIVMADSVKTIGQYAFNNCDALVDVIIPDGVETVEREAFYDCSALTRVKFPMGTTSIGYHCFNRSPNVIIVCLQGSYAEQYAIDNNIPFEYYDCAHKFKETVITEPTCTENGTSAFVCTTCLTEYTQEVPALGHDLITHEAKEPTCVDIGWNAFDTCSRCDYTTYEEIPALGHTMSEWYTVIEPNCTEEGLDRRDCQICDHSETLVTVSLGHDYISHEAKAPTCVDIGWDAYDTCSRCDYTTYVELPALGHELIAHGAKAPTCTEIGWNEYNTCARCDYTTYAEIPALGHDLVSHEAKEPTCLDYGWQAYETCSRCDYTTYAELSALGHDLVSHEAKAPVCEEIGWEAYETCSRCDYTTYVELPALEHDETFVTVESTCTERGYTAAICSKCGMEHYRKKLPLADHVYDKHGACVACGTTCEVLLSVGNAYTTAGGTITVPLMIDINSGFTFLNIDLFYDDSVLELVSVENGEIFDEMYADLHYIWAFARNVTDTGILATLTFRVKEDAPVGIYKVTAKCTECCDYDEQDVIVGVNAGKIHVNDVVLGDCNGDNAVNGKDVTRLLRYLSTFDPATGTADIELGAGADCTGDGVINGKDVTRLLRYLASYDPATGESSVVLGMTE